MSAYRKQEFLTTVKDSENNYIIKNNQTREEFKNSMAKFELIHRILDNIIENDILYFASGQ